jgi:cholest-4-en-3-one 26-monooxygenase
MLLHDIDLTDADLFQRGTPHEAFALLRREAPVHWHAEPGGPGFFAITRHADVRAVSTAPDVFSSERMGTLRMDPPEAVLAMIRNMMLNMDPPKHRRYRALVNKAFTPRMVEGLREQVASTVTRILDDVVERGACEFVEDVAAILPMEIICEMMGVPREDRRRIYEIGNKMVGFEDPELQPDGQAVDIATADATVAFGEMFVYATKLHEIALREPRDNLATALVHAELDGERLSAEDFQWWFQLLLVAGNETTRTVTSNGLCALIANPEQMALLRADPSLVPSAVEEILRVAPPVHAFRRQTTRDTEIRGARIPADSKVMVWYPSANRDEEVFADAQRFDVRRSPNEHLSFGIGEHYCLGANLARLELREIFAGIVARLHDVEHTAPPRRLRSTFINGVKEMRIAFRPGPRVGAPGDAARAR